MLIHKHARVVMWLLQLTRLRSRLGSVINVSVVLTSDNSADVVDDKLIETTAEFVKRTGVMTNQIEVRAKPCVIRDDKCGTDHAKQLTL